MAHPFVKNKLQAGFTIIEMMVSLALFTIVITIAVGAFLSLIGGSSQLQGEQSVMSSMTFALDSMTREIRTGRYYYCSSANASDNKMEETAVLRCTNGATSISFLESGTSLTGTTGNHRISYSFVENGDDEKKNLLLRQIGDGDPQPLLSSDVTLVSARFYVSGVTAGDILQPIVTVILQAKDPNDTTDTIHTLETTVTQRELDI